MRNDEATRFKPGNNANPRGRPKVPTDVKDAARAYTKEAIGVLADVMRNDKELGSARVRAAECLLNRAWGTPESTTHVTVTQDVRDLSTAEILSSLAALGVAGAQAGADEPPAVH